MGDIREIKLKYLLISLSITYFLNYYDSTYCMMKNFIYNESIYVDNIEKWENLTKNQFKLIDKYYYGIGKLEIESSFFDILTNSYSNITPSNEEKSLKKFLKNTFNHPVIVLYDPIYEEIILRTITHSDIIENHAFFVKEITKLLSPLDFKNENIPQFVSDTTFVFEYNYIKEYSKFTNVSFKKELANVINLTETQNILEKTIKNMQDLNNDIHKNMLKLTAEDKNSIIYKDDGKNITEIVKIDENFYTLVNYKNKTISINNIKYSFNIPKKCEIF